MFQIAARTTTGFEWPYAGNMYNISGIHICTAGRCNKRMRHSQQIRTYVPGTTLGIIAVATARKKDAHFCFRVEMRGGGGAYVFLICVICVICSSCRPVVAVYVL